MELHLQHAAQAHASHMAHHQSMVNANFERSLHMVRRGTTGAARAVNTNEFAVKLAAQMAADIKDGKLVMGVDGEIRLDVYGIVYTINTAGGEVIISRDDLENNYRLPNEVAKDLIARLIAKANS